MSDVEKRLAELRAAREKREAEREAKRAVAELEAQLQDEMQMAADAETIDRLEAEHGAVDKRLKIVRLLTDAGRAVTSMIIVKTPHHLHYRKFAERGDKMTLIDVTQFVMPQIVHPEKAVATAAFEAEPHALVRVASACTWLAGARKEIDDPK